MTEPAPALPLSKAFRTAVVVLSALLALSGVVVTALAVMAPVPVWLLIGFEIVVIAAGVIGVLFGLNRFQEGQGLALACVAGTVFVATVLGYIANKGQAGDLKLWFVARMAMTGLFTLAAAWVVLARNNASWRYVRLAAVTGLPLVLVAGVYAIRPAVFGQIGAALPEWIAKTLVALGLLAAMGLFAASVHCLIRAFEQGRTLQQRSV